MTNEWQPIATAPKDGRVIMSVWHDDPVFIAWFEAKPAKEREEKRLLRKPTQIVVREAESACWRVLIWGPRNGFGVHGQCAPFEPIHWMPLPAPPLPSPDGGKG